MRKKLYNVGCSILTAFLVLLVCGPVTEAPDAKVKQQDATSEQSEKITVCELKSDPGNFNHKLIEVTGFISHGFEDFALFDPDCPASPDVWLEYGGKNASGTMYCCGVTAERTRPKEASVENIRISLVKDAKFQEFDKLIQRRPDSVVHATIVGRFFAGKLQKLATGSYWMGYGHMGCCSLLMIQQVLSVDPQNRGDLDYRASADQPNENRVGCGYRFLLPLRPQADLIEAQRQADEGSRDWVFNDPKRVAVDALAQSLHLGSDSAIEMAQIRQAQGRIIYEWKPRRKKVTYMVVVSRPYWLSFYSRDERKVAWAAIAAYEAGCGKGNSVTRAQ
jgi:hypothetical protein